MTVEPVPFSAASRPRATDVADAVTVGEQTVVFLEGELHTLNGPAGLIWRSCDGETPLGAVATDLAAAFGADPAAMLDDVVATATDLRERGLVHDPGEPGAAAAAVGIARTPAKPTLVPEPACSGCGEGPEYECRLTVDVGPALVTVGMDRGTADAFVRALGRRVVDRADAAPGRPSYGVVYPPRSPDRSPQPVARLHRGPDVLVRHRDARRVLEALVAQLAMHAISDSDLLVEAIAVGRPGAVVLVANPANPVAYERRAAALGLVVSDVPTTVVDPADRVAIVGAPDWTVERSALAELVATRATGPEPSPALPAARHRIVGIAVPERTDVGGVLAAIGPRLADTADPRRTWLDLAALVAAVPVIDATDPRAVGRLLDESGIAGR